MSRLLELPCLESETDYWNFVETRFYLLTMRNQAVDSAKANLIGDRVSVCTDQALKTRKAIDGLLQVPRSWVTDRNKTETDG